MQTFLPYSDFVQTARVLDRARLGKQRLEALQIVRVTHAVRYGLRKVSWANHPARLMWNDHAYALCLYGIEICKEWANRGYEDNLRPEFEDYLKIFKDTGMPPWLGSVSFHTSHRSNLLRKGRERLEKKGKNDILLHYRGLWPKLTDSLPYVWPVRKTEA